MKEKIVMHRQSRSLRRCAIFVALILNRLVHKTKRLLLITNTNARDTRRESSAEIVAARVIAPESALKIMLFSNGTHHGSDDDYLPAFTYSSRSQPKRAFLLSTNT